MGLVDSWGWDCHYFNAIAPCNISASQVHQARWHALTGYMRDVQTESAGDRLTGTRSLWQSREPNFSWERNAALTFPMQATTPHLP